MLRIFRVEAQRLDYYLDVTESGSDRAFRERDGFWRTSRSRGEPGESVDGAQLRAVMMGTDPATSTPLNPLQHRVRYCALDATFAAPKSVSLLHALGDAAVQQAVEIGHRESVHDAMNFVDRHIITVRLKEQGIRRSRLARTPPQAVFEHRTSRSADPHLHSHVLVPNVATADGSRWSAVSSGPFLFHSGLIGALYRASLRRRLSLALGTRWRETRPGWYDIDGLSGPMLWAFSRRSAEILSERTQSGFVSPRATMLSATLTRSARADDVCYEELRADWQARAFREGISRGRFTELIGRDQPTDQERYASITSAFAPFADPQRRATVAQVLRTVADHARDGFFVREVESAVVEAVASKIIKDPTELWPFGPRGDRRSVELSRGFDVRRSPRQLHIDVMAGEPNWFVDRRLEPDMIAR